MINTGRVRVTSAIAVPTMSATRWEYVSGGLADWLFEFIQKIFLFLSLVVVLSFREFHFYFSYFSQVKLLTLKKLILLQKWHRSFLYIAFLLQMKYQISASSWSN
jgi:hypothetical protein